MATTALLLQAACGARLAASSPAAFVRPFVAAGSVRARATAASWAKPRSRGRYLLMPFHA